jgi:hypothetical protein
MPGSVHKEQAIPHCLGSYSDLEPTAGRMATRTCGSVSGVLPLGGSSTCTDCEFAARGLFLVEGSQR